LLKIEDPAIRDDIINNNKKIHNLNVMGRVGNYNEVFPNFPYQFLPEYTAASQGDYIHIQFSGSDTYNFNNDVMNVDYLRNAPENLRRRDRSNLVAIDSYSSIIPNLDVKNIFGFSELETVSLATGRNYDGTPITVSERDFTTKPDYRYQQIPFPGRLDPDTGLTEFQFKVKAKYDAYVLLCDDQHFDITTNPWHNDDLEGCFEIILGGWRNTRSVLRPGIGVNPNWDMSKKLWHVDNGKTTLDNSGQNYRTFKVVFGPQHLQVYRETEAKNGVDFENEPFMEARDFKTDPEDGFSTGIKKVSKVGFASGQGITAEWKANVENDVFEEVGRYYDSGLKKLDTVGSWKFMSTVNNRLGLTSQKGRVDVVA